jgi:predicted amidohydrolase
MTRIACCRLAPRLGDLAANRAMVLRALSAADADIVVLPELVTSGYAFSSRDEAASVAIGADDPLLAEWGTAGPSLVVGGFCEQGADGQLYNSAAVVDSTGVLAVYRKTHLWDRERLIFTPGADMPPVLETAFGRIGVLVCYDLEFPEMPRALALRGADLICAPVNWPVLEVPPAGERPPEQLTAMSAARVNRVFIAVCDREGTERGVEWVGGTGIIDENGWVAGTSSADIELTRARDKALSGLSDAFADRRPELYADITHQVT